MSRLSFHVIPRDAKADSEWEKYTGRQRELRLRSLQHDPGSFVSRYESEVKEPTSFWISRLKDPNAWTVVMIRGPEKMPEDGEVLLREDVEWVGFCVMVDARKLPQSMLERENVNKSEYGGEWFMAAVWLIPEIRGQGAGKRLVQFGIDLIKAQNTRDGIDGGYCVTQVVQGNNHALELYKKLGFEVSDANATMEKEGRTYSNTELRLAL